MTNTNKQTDVARAERQRCWTMRFLPPGCGRTLTAAAYRAPSLLPGGPVRRRSPLDLKLPRLSPYFSFSLVSRTDALCLVLYHTSLFSVQVIKALPIRRLGIAPIPPIHEARLVFDSRGGGGRELISTLLVRGYLKPNINKRQDAVWAEMRRGR
jgi:hypothetical protein